MQRARSSTALLAAFLFAPPLFAAAQVGVLDQQSPWTGVEVPSYGVSYQQIVRAERSGVLGSVFVWVDGEAGDWVTLSVQREDGWRFRPALCFESRAKAVTGIEEFRADFQDCRMELRAGERFVLSVTVYGPTGAVAANYVAPPGQPLYPEAMFENRASGCYLDCGWRLAFRTHVVPCDHERLLDQVSPVTNAGFWATAAAPIHQRARVGKGGTLEGFSLRSFGSAGGTVTVDLRLGADWVNQPPVFGATAVRTTSSFEDLYFDLAPLGLHVHEGDYLVLGAWSHQADVRGSYHAPPLYPEPIFHKGFKNVRPEQYRLGFRTYVTPAALPRLHRPDPGLAGGANELPACGLPPGATVWLAAGLAPGATPIPGCAGLALDIDRARTVARATTNARGEARFMLYVPAAAAGVTAWFQALDPAACVVSDVVDFGF